MVQFSYNQINTQNMSVDPIVKKITSCDDLHGEAKEVFESFAKSGGKTPKWVQVMANCDDTMVGFVTLLRSVMDDAPLPQELKWKVAYVVSDINKCEFCVGATASKLKGFGIDETVLTDIEGTANEKEKLAIAYAKATTEHAYSIAPELIEKMQEHFTDEELVELTAVIGTFNFINRFNDALRILPDA
jgi:AhpD family alkylhydroperoxidase